MSIGLLIADDEEVNRELLAVILQKEGYKLFFAVDGEETLDVIAKESIDVVLLDLMMPKMNGFDVLKVLKDHNSSNPKIIIVSALTQEDSAPFIDKYEADAYVTKPYDIVALKQQIRSLIEPDEKEEIVTLSDSEWQSLVLEFLEKSTEPIELKLHFILECMEENGLNKNTTISTVAKEEFRELIKLKRESMLQ